MLNLKKTALAVIALGSTAAFAGTMGPVCSAVNVTVPCETCAWDFGGRALYLQPAGFSNLAGYYTLETNAAAGAQTRTFGANPNWGWGWQLEASYHYSTGNDVNVNWYHFRNGTTYNPITSTNPQNVIFGSGTTYNYSNFATSVNPAWDQVNIEVGQHVDFGENKFARLHGGFNFSRVGNTGYVAETYREAGSSTNPTENRTDNVTSSLNAFGPRVGMDLNYEWGNGLGVYADGALSVLAGSSKASLNHIDYRVPTNTFTVSTSRNNVVGELDAKVGFMYTYACAQGDLSLDVGWVWASYTSGIDSVQAVSQDTQVQTQNTGWGIQGLYFGAKWIGNIA